MRKVSSPLSRAATFCVAGIITVAATAVAAAAPVTAGGVAQNSAILKGTGPYEDDAGAADLAKILSAADAREFETLRRRLHAAVAGKDDVAAADHAVTIFRMLVDRLDPATLVVPKEVELLDFEGYKVAVLAAAATEPDWPAIARLAAEGEAWWKAIAPAVTDKHLRATVTSAIAGTKQAAELKDRAMLQFGSQMILDLVDMLEGSFKNAKKVSP
jgi:hypothetical protein